jgi:metal-responsive CopG/Arc/MetJ family transcriptional regulator
MAVYKVNVSLPEVLVSEIDEVAASMGLSRSGFIAEASSRYVTDVKNLSAEKQRKKNVDRAIASMRRIGAKLSSQDIQDMIDQTRRDRDRDTPEEWRR